MDIVLVVAVLRLSSVEAVEKALQQMGVCEITVTKVRGYGEYVDFLSRDHLVEQVKLEVFSARDQALHIARTIMDAANAHAPGDGAVAILPTEATFNLRVRPEAGASAGDV